jgi:hypothetical protein
LFHSSHVAQISSFAGGDDLSYRDLRYFKRSTGAAQVIEQVVLMKRHRALVIYGEDLRRKTAVLRSIVG